MLLNIDRPRRSGTLHLDDCPQVPQPIGTPFKPVEAMGRDGGWFAVASTAEAKQVLRRSLPKGEFATCTTCIES